MGRRDPDDSQVPRQLTLDDWTDELRVGRSPLAVAASAGRKARRGAPRSRGVGQTGGAAPQATEGVPNEETSQQHRLATELLSMRDALLTRTRLRDLGLERRAVDAVFRALPVVALPGYSRPMVRVEDYLELLERNTFRDDRVRPTMRAS